MDELRWEENRNNLDDLKELDEVKIWVDDMLSGRLKEAINLFVWQWGHPKLTLSQAEKIAVGIFDVLNEK